MSINFVALSGNLTRDCVTRQTTSGTTVAGFGLAVNERRKNTQTGEWEDVPHFVDCTMFGTRAQAIAQYLKKGLKVSLTGKLRYSSWQTQDGNKRSKLEVIVDEIEFMSRREEQQQTQPPVNPQVAHAAQQAQAATGYPMNYGVPQFQEVPQTVYDAEIPF